MRVAVASDHAGSALRARLVGRLTETGHEAVDLGPPGQEPVDYPVYARRVCAAVLDGSADRGILICRTGLGMSMAANRCRGIRAALCLFPLMAETARRHNDANVLVMGAGITADFLAAEILDVFLRTGFDGGRHAGRVAAIEPPAELG
jgi:ribose 5-phosphate isomerase B